MKNITEQENKPRGKGYGILIRNIIIFFLSIIILCLVFVIYLMDSFNDPKTDIPVRHNNIPTSAIWNGGPDGGHWYELVDVRDSIYRFRVYNENSGELLLDADYKLKCPKITKDNWGKIYPYYTVSSDFDSLQVIESYKYLYFESIYPAYGGSDWEIIKEKYKINQ